MATPLMMLGPGGDYVTRFDVKGSALVRSQATRTSGYDPNADSAGTLSAWARLRRRKKKPATEEQPTPFAREADRFEHVEPQRPATYTKATPGQLQQKLALIQAGEQWLDRQGKTIDELASQQTQAERLIAEAGRSAAAGEPTVRVIRWNGSTMTLPRPVNPTTSNTPHSSRPLPEHVFTDQPVVTPEACARPLADQPTEPTQLDAQLHVIHTAPNTPPPSASPTDVHPQPHAQADEDPHDDPRLAAVPWLFPDHAGTGRRPRRVQGHGLRARRSAHQKGLPGPGCEQGALFGAVA